MMVVAAAALVLVGRRFGVPSIVSSMLAGFVLGPILGLVDPADEAAGTASVALVSEVGIVLLLFLVGLELSLSEIRAVGAVAVSAAVGQCLVMAGLVFAVGLALGIDPGAIVVLAIAMGFSSTVVVVKQLESRGELDRPFGRISIGILLVQDLIVVIVLTVIAGLGSAGVGAADAGSIGGDGPGMDAAMVATAMLKAFGLMAVLLGATLLCARFVLPPLFGRIDRSPAAALVAALAWCFVLVESAYVMGLSVEIGAFLAGLGLGGLPHRNDLLRRVKPLMGFFIAVFFASLGARIDFGDLVEGWPLALALTLIVLVVKPPVFHAIARRMGHDRRTSVDVSITLMQISEFSLILGAAAVAVPGLLDEDAAGAIGMLGIVALVTIIVSVLAMNGRERIHARLGTTGPADESIGPGQGDAPCVHGHHPPPPEDHVVVVGMNALGRALVRSLAARGENVVAIDTDARKLAGLPARTVLGDVDHGETREEARLAQARLAVCALRIESANRLFAHRCRELGVPVVVHAFDRALRPELERLGPAFVLDSKRSADEPVARVLGELGLVPGGEPARSAEHGPC